MCVFKYFVTESDPQRYFSLAILSTNLICFLVICLSYAAIGREANQSSSNNKVMRKHNQQLQLKIGLIILTDFLCWVPYVTVCFLHYSELIDATSWYTNFSIIILPINSTINPLLYHTIFQDWGRDISRWAKDKYTLIINGLRRKITHYMIPTQDETDGEVKIEEAIELIEVQRI